MDTPRHQWSEQLHNELMEKLRKEVGEFIKFHQDRIDIKKGGKYPPYLGPETDEMDLKKHYRAVIVENPSPESIELDELFYGDTSKELNIWDAPKKFAEYIGAMSIEQCAVSIDYRDEERDKENKLGHIDGVPYASPCEPDYIVIRIAFEMLGEQEIDKLVHIYKVMQFGLNCCGDYQDTDDSAFMALRIARLRKIEYKNYDKKWEKETEFRYELVLTYSGHYHS